VSPGWVAEPPPRVKPRSGQRGQASKAMAGLVSVVPAGSLERSAQGCCPRQDVQKAIIGSSWTSCRPALPVRGSSAGGNLVQGVLPRHAPRASGWNRSRLRHRDKCGMLAVHGH